MDSTSRISRSRAAVVADLESCTKRLQVDDPHKRLIYDNQQEVALEIVSSFITDAVYLAVLIAQMQVGKTGACLATAYHMCTHPDDNKVIDMNNVVIITGMSDTEWKEQTQKSMITSFATNVFHRGNFKDTRLVELLRNRSNMLIIIDEAHIASQISQQLSLLLKETNILNIETLRERNIRIMQVSATPGATLQDAIEWGSHSKVFQLQPSPRYVSFQKLKDAGRMRDAMDLSKYENVRKLATYIEAEYATKKYHIIRVKGSQDVELNIGRMCVLRGWKVINHNSQDRWDAELLKSEPSVHTFILIKDMWRAAKQICDIHIGVVHEAFVKKADASANAQGLAGRCCGNDKQIPGEGTPTIFCNLRAINQYIDWINNNTNYRAINEYQSRDINVRNGRLRTVPTMTHVSNVEGFEESTQEPEESIYDFPVWCSENGFKSLDEIKDFLKHSLNRTVRLRDFHEVNGYKLTTRLTNHYGKTKEQLTAEDRLTYDDYKASMAGVNVATDGKKGQHYMVYPVYPNKQSGPETVRYYYSILKSVVTTN